MEIETKHSSAFYITRSTEVHYSLSIGMGDSSKSISAIPIHEAGSKKSSLLKPLR